MAKELPYFQFEPAEYLTKDVSFCSLSAQGLFINICSYYWQRQCDLSKEQFLRRFNYENEFNELVKEGVIDLIESKIVVKFLLSQYLRATEKSTVNSSNGAKGGRPKNPIKSETKANEKPIKSETKGIREDKIIKEEKKKDKENIICSEDFLIVWNEYKKYRTSKRKTFKFAGLKYEQMAFDKFFKLSNGKIENAKKIVNQSIENNWDGLFELKTENIKSNGKQQHNNRS